MTTGLLHMREGCVASGGGGDERLREAVNVIERNRARQREANTRGAWRHRGRANGFDGESGGLQFCGDTQCSFIRAKNHGDDWRVSGAAMQASSAKRGAENAGNFAEMSATIIGFADERKCGANLMRDVGRIRGAENEAASVIHEKVFDVRATANESAAGRERFSARIDGGENAAVILEASDEAAAFASTNADGMSFVDDEVGAEGFRELRQLFERRKVSLHAENTFGDEQFCARRVCVLLKRAFEKL